MITHGVESAKVGGPTQEMCRAQAETDLLGDIEYARLSAEAKRRG
jgi:hypothetical protein